MLEQAEGEPFSTAKDPQKDQFAPNWSNHPIAGYTAGICPCEHCRLGAH